MWALDLESNAAGFCSRMWPGASESILIREAIAGDMVLTLGMPLLLKGQSTDPRLADRVPPIEWAYCRTRVTMAGTRVTNYYPEPFIIVVDEGIRYAAGSQ